MVNYRRVESRLVYLSLSCPSNASHTPFTLQKFCCTHLIYIFFFLSLLIHVREPLTLVLLHAGEAVLMRRLKCRSEINTLVTENLNTHTHFHSLSTCLQTHSAQTMWLLSVIYMRIIMKLNCQSVLKVSCISFLTIPLRIKCMIRCEHETG